jgi:hypothetical protein
VMEQFVNVAVLSRRSARIRERSETACLGSGQLGGNSFDRA